MVHGVDTFYCLTRYRLGRRRIGIFRHRLNYLGVHPAAMRPAAGRFCIIAIFHQRMIRLVTVRHDCSVIAFHVLLQHRTVSGTQMLIQEYRMAAVFARRMEYPHIFLTVGRHHKRRLVTMEIPRLKDLSLHPIVYWAEIILPYAYHPPGKILTRNVYILSQKLF